VIFGQLPFLFLTEASSLLVIKMSPTYPQAKSDGDFPYNLVKSDELHMDVLGGVPHSYSSTFQRGVEE
jgi:hypothetical protein